jgi:hypothetical protein
MSSTPTIQSIRARARRVIVQAGGQYAKKRPTAADRAAGPCDRGVVIDEAWGSFVQGTIAVVVAESGVHQHRTQDLNGAVEALRTAGWTVTEEGNIMALPVKS